MLALEDSDMGYASTADRGSSTGIFGEVKRSLDSGAWLGCSSTDLWAGSFILLS